MIMLEKWKKAVIHLECATDSVHFYDKVKKEEELRDKLEKGEISQQNYLKERLAIWEASTRDLRYQGTALFLCHNSKRFLITARHVIFDENSAKREFQEEVERVSSWPSNRQKDILQDAEERTQNLAFNIIFRVPSLDEVINDTNRSPPEFLMNLRAGTSFTVPYTFSSPELDLAIISLDQRDSRFAEELMKSGYEPVSLEDITDEPTQEGRDIFTVGFPSSTSLIGQVNQHPALSHWSSSHISLPVFTFGRVSMLHEQLPFYWTDMSIYPGNSGGPVIENNKLVGIVSAQATLPIDSEPNIVTRIPFGKIIKAKYLFDLINQQEKKDNF